jgi:hypothetical protein
MSAYGLAELVEDGAPLVQCVGASRSPLRNVPV